MKKLLSLLLLLLCLFLAAQGEQLTHVADQAGIFTADQIRTLEARMQDIFDTYNFDTVITTTNDSRGLSARMYAADFYNQFRSPSRYPDGALFSFSFDLREYNEVARGLGITILGSQSEEALHRVLRPHLEEEDFFGAMLAYLDSVEQSLSRYTVTGEDGKVTLGNTKQAPSLSQSIRIATSYLPYLLVGGLIIGLLAALYMKSRLLIAKPQRSADQYALPGSLNLYDSDDIFLYKTVTRTRIQENKSRGGGGGGGSTFRSGGTTYSSRGGKF